MWKKKIKREWFNRTIKYNVIIDKSPSWRNLGGEKVKYSRVRLQSSAMIIFEKRRLHFMKIEKLVLALIVYYLRSPCLYFLNNVNRNANKPHGNFQMLWFLNFWNYVLLAFLFISLVLYIHFNQFMLFKYLEIVNPYCQAILQCNKNDLIFMFVFIQYLFLSAYLVLTISLCVGNTFLLTPHLSNFLDNGSTEAGVYLGAHFQHWHSLLCK